MSYVIKIYKGDTMIKRIPWVGKFAPAKDYAKENLPVLQKQKGVTRIEVRDAETDNLMFHLPRLLHAQRS